MTRKSTRLILIVAIALLVLISVAAVLINLYRDSIALEVARTALRDSGIQVSDVSVESIGADEVRFEAIVLELAGGGTVFIEGITLPVRFRGLRGSTLHIRRLRFESGATDTGPIRFAEGLQNFLDAPALTPGATIRVDELLLPDMPVIRDLAWHADQLNPTLRAAAGAFELFLTTTEESDGTYRGSVRALMPDDTETLMLGFQLAPAESGFRVRGNVSAVLGPLLPALRAIGAVPAEVTEVGATMSGAFEFGVEADAALPVRIQATLDAPPGASLAYEADDNVFDLSVIQATPINAVFEFPSLDWTARVASVTVRIDGAGLDLPPVRLRNSECRAGIRCRTAFDASYEDLALGALTIDRIMASSATVEFAGEDGTWEASAPDTGFTLKGLAYGGHPILAPAIRADLVASNDRLSASARLTTPDGGISAKAELSHDLVDGRGNLSLGTAAIEFDKLGLADIFRDWPYDFEIEAGRGEAEAGIRWTSTNESFAYEGTAAITADALAGRYADIGFVGFGGRLDAELDSEAGLSLKPTRFDVALVDVGFPVENIRGEATPNLDESAVEVSALSMSVLGGTVMVDPFRYELGAESNELTLRVDGIQLPLMAGLADLEAVTISGSVSGEIPVTIRGNKVVIDDGHLENDPPGGFIRYRGGAATGVVDDASQLGIVTRTLRNFEFDSLTSAVDYSRDGDLVLNMRLKGINPDVDPTQPVILNLNVENNVPQMLRSLQATRSIEDVLETRLSK